MKTAGLNILDGKGYEIVELLQGLNVPGTESICIACLVCGEELPSQDIEKTSGLRQPEVSIAMRPLRDRKWIEERNEKKNSDKGRPLKYYKLVVPFDHIVEIFEDEVLKKNREIEEALEQLKELSSSN